MIITLISDTHSKHNQITQDLPGGDLIICAGDISSRGYDHEIKNFCKWFEKLPYDKKIFIVGNHDFYFKDNPLKSKEIIDQYKITYLQDDYIYIGEHPNLVKIYGSPWQPEFCNWAFNLPRDGQELEDCWSLIPNDVDILITHGPPNGYLDRVTGRYEMLGCEKLAIRIKEIKPKIHVFGHIHSGYGYGYDGTHFINAAVLGEDYAYNNKPLTIDWDCKTNEIKFI